MRKPSESTAGDKTPDWALRLRNARKLTGLGPTEFARRAGLSQQRYSNYERGMREPNMNAWAKIVTRLPVSLDFIIIGRTGSERQPNEK